MADARDLARYLRKQISSHTTNHHQAMDAGQPQDQYLRLVGRQAQLRDVESWIVDGLTKLEVEDDDA